jgi:hypothetical protein
LAGKKNSQKRAERRRLAASAARREKHVKLVVDRQGDYRFVQQTRTPEGRTLTWDPQSEQGNRITKALQKQRAAFIEKFGREPGPDDPIFFDPDADEPTPFGLDDDEADIWEDISAAAEQVGLDPAHIHAFREVGYLITESNQHLFTAMQVEAYWDAVSRHGRAT